MLRLPYALACISLFAAGLGAAPVAHAQAAAPASQGSAATLTVRIRRDTAPDALPVAAVLVRSGAVSARTDANGEARLRLAAGAHTIVAVRLGYRPDSASVVMRAGADTTVQLVMIEQPTDVGAVIVSATRGERRVEDTPIRVEIIDSEEVAEKVAMSPGDIAMMLNETSGLRVQPTNPSLGGAGVRVQGLRGRYTLILADGLPLYGAQAGGLGLLQIPPVDLQRVEIIKGAASALYGSSALGGVIDLVSRPPGEEPERTLLFNQTSRGGTDAVGFAAGKLSENVGITMLAGAHRQRRNDLDADGWTDMPGYERLVLRPRLHLNDEHGRSAFLTGGYTTENRDGGTLGSRVTPAGTAYVESLHTRRADVGGLVRMVGDHDTGLFGINVLSDAILTVRGSAVEQRHEHRFGTVPEDDRHRTGFAEAALALPRGTVTYVAGAAYQRESYSAQQTARFDYAYDIPALFAQVDVDASASMSLSASVRADAHSEYGTFVNPRVSLLFRAPDVDGWRGWTSRLSAGTGAFAPTPFVEETEVTGLAPLFPLVGLRAERARSASLDIGGPVSLGIGELELNGTLFGSRVAHALLATGVAFPPPPGSTYGGIDPIAVVNAPAPTRTWGAEALARLVHSFGDDEETPALRITATYTHMRSTECVVPLFGSTDRGGLTPDDCMRRPVALTPRHSAGIVTTIEQEGRSRIGLELYYTGRQRLEGNPYRSESKPYLIVGLMGERAFDTRAGTARLFLNFENLTDVRQTRFDPLLLPSRGLGGRWTTDAWTDLSGFTVNGGVRWSF